MTEALTCEWARYNIRINAIAPGPFPSPLNQELLKTPRRLEHVMDRVPMKRFGKTEELVGAAVYLASEASSYVIGQALVVNGGLLAHGL